MPDLVDEPFRDFVQPLGNLVILFAQAEAAILELTTDLNSGNEDAAKEILKKDNHPKILLRLLLASNLGRQDLRDTVNSLRRFRRDKEHRNRLIHDEWFVGLYPDTEPVWAVGTRGLPRPKRAAVIYREPNADAIWQLAKNFREQTSAISHASWMIRKGAE